MKSDLHFHSKYSDGTLWPSEMIELAKEKNLEIIALTDHDTFAGVPEFLELCQKKQIKGVAAVEIDFVDKIWGFKTEILGYFPNGKYFNTKSFLEKYSNSRRILAEKSIQLANNIYKTDNLSINGLIKHKLKEEISEEKMKLISLTKPDIYLYLKESINEFEYNDYKTFKNSFFNNSYLKDISNVKPELKECIEIICKDDGYPVLAHPGYEFEKNIDLFEKYYNEYLSKLFELKKIGLWGIEIHSYDEDIEANRINSIVNKLAKETNLNLTYGSDSHGNNHVKKKRDIGNVFGTFKGFN